MLHVFGYKSVHSKLDGQLQKIIGVTRIKGFLVPYVIGLLDWRLLGWRQWSVPYYENTYDHPGIVRNKKESTRTTSNPTKQQGSQLLQGVPGSRIKDDSGKRPNAVRTVLKGKRRQARWKNQSYTPGQTRQWCTRGPKVSRAVWKLDLVLTEPSAHNYVNKTVLSPQPGK